MPVMRICIPTVDDRGLEARISEHFGSAPFYTLVDTETGRLETLPNSHPGHGSGQAHARGACRALATIGPHNCDAVVCRGMGRGAMATLESMLGICRLPFYRRYRKYLEKARV